MTGPAVQIPAEARGHCRSCQAPIIWVRTERGKLMPLDDEEVLAAGEALFEIDNAGVARRSGERGRRSHFATCPNADQHRKAR